MKVSIYSQFLSLHSRFGGYALADTDWNKARDSLLERIGTKGRDQLEGPDGYYMSVSYDSPKKNEGRRNEVWLPIREDAEVLDKEMTFLQSTVIRAEQVKKYEISL